MRASVVRTLLVDIDLGARRVIAIEPGPGSVTTAWQPLNTVETRGEDVAVAQAAYADSAARVPRLVRLSPGGPSFLRYDGARSLDSRQRDWPVSLVFTGHATIATVKRALRTIGFTHLGHPRYLAYATTAAGRRFDVDRGLKTPCDTASTDAHVRLYAPPAGTSATRGWAASSSPRRTSIATTAAAWGRSCTGSRRSPSARSRARSSTSSAGACSAIGSRSATPSRCAATFATPRTSGSATGAPPSCACPDRSLNDRRPALATGL